MVQVIPCLHDAGVVLDTTKVTPNYHPLTMEQIAELLAETKGLFRMSREEVRTFSQIQIRLSQGIPGFECPHAIDGPVAEKQNQIDKLFCEQAQRGADPELVQQFYSIMND